jgi:hypothetical protein
MGRESVQMFVIYGRSFNIKVIKRALNFIALSLVAWSRSEFPAVSGF